MQFLQIAVAMGKKIAHRLEKSRDIRLESNEDFQLWVMSQTAV